MTSKEILLEQMAACHNQNRWILPMTDALTGLTEEQALWKSALKHNNILEVLNHLIYLSERFLPIFKENKQVEPKKENTFECVYNWTNASKKIFTLFSEWEKELKETDENKLNSKVFEDKDPTWYSILTQMIIHNAYHIGQIVTIRKEQGSWNTEPWMS